MSRIGKQPVSVPSGVTVSVNDRDVTVESSKGRLSMTHRPEVTVKVEDGNIIIDRNNDSRLSKAMHGLTRSLIQNMVVGVTDGYTRNLEVNGSGWTARVQGRTVMLNVGYADTREVEIPMGIEVAVEGNKIKVTGTDKQAVGQLAADIRRQRKPEPYNGKGIKYAEEVIIRKAGKQFAGGG